MDASNSGIGDVLSQHQSSTGKLHPCAFYSRKLTAAKDNYDVGNRELLSIKAALEEWRHWLEGARHPFLLLTDHRNLEYLRGAKRLNPRQACWALFFTRFQFSVTYHPGSKNRKADALSRLQTHSTQRNTHSPRNCYHLVPPGVPELRVTRRHYIGPGAPLHFTVCDGAPPEAEVSGSICRASSRENTVS
ncbi:hypothetical protein QTP86_007576 [Hemibagrus guttatus]|nr:hypothetical protein QTP86_007576 [Hemibagrus guttatus]